MKYISRYIQNSLVWIFKMFVPPIANWVIIGSIFLDVYFLLLLLCHYWVNFFGCLLLIIIIVELLGQSYG